MATAITEITAIFFNDTVISPVVMGSSGLLGDYSPVCDKATLGWFDRFSICFVYAAQAVGYCRTKIYPADI
jgi:hypothetical protein